MDLPEGPLQLVGYNANHSLRTEFTEFSVFSGRSGTATSPTSPSSGLPNRRSSFTITLYKLHLTTYRSARNLLRSSAPSRSHHKPTTRRCASATALWRRCYMLCCTRVSCWCRSVRCRALVCRCAVERGRRCAGLCMRPLVTPGK